MKATIKPYNRISGIFKNKKRNLLSVYFTAGYPSVDSTVDIIQALDRSGVDLIEIGVPFSDPVADGKVIQHSSQGALKNGITVNRLLDQLKDIRASTDIPLIMMGYLNPIYRFGFEKFCDQCAEIGIDGLIIPDLPLNEISGFYGPIMMDRNLKSILLISPNTTLERIRQIDSLTTGFLYVVSSASTTGATDVLSEDQIKYFEEINNMDLANKTLIGFGISDKQFFQTACKYADGAIIGSAFIKWLDMHGSTEKSISEFINSILL